jgi:hypothetical protein
MVVSFVRWTIASIRDDRSGLVLGALSRDGDVGEILRPVPELNQVNPLVMRRPPKTVCYAGHLLALDVAQ